MLYKVVSPVKCSLSGIKKFRASILNWDCGFTLLPRSVVEMNWFFVVSVSDIHTWHTGTYSVDILHQSVSRVRNVWPWSTSWFTVQNTLILKIHVLMLTQLTLWKISLFFKLTLGPPITQLSYGWPSVWYTFVLLYLILWCVTVCLVSCMSYWNKSIVYCLLSIVYCLLSVRDTIPPVLIISFIQRAELIFNLMVLIYRHSCLLICLSYSRF